MAFDGNVPRRDCIFLASHVYPRPDTRSFYHPFPLLMATWENLFEGYNIYSDVYDAHPNLYQEATSSGATFELYRQIVRDAPEDVSMLTAVFFSSVFLPVLLASLLFVMFGGFLTKIRVWR